LNAGGEILGIIDLAENTVKECGGINKVINAYKHSFENVSQTLLHPNADVILDTAIDTSASTTAVAVNTLLSPVNAGTRLITGGKDFTVTGDDIKKLANDPIGESVKAWGNGWSNVKWLFGFEK
jgi:hypothetical protein